MRIETVLERTVLDELHWDPTTREAEIAVAESDGVVTLSGRVDTYVQKYAAERAVERVVGVKVVADALDVGPAGLARHTDADVRRAVGEALAWDAEVPRDRVTATVEDGWVVLEGSVDWRYQRAAAERNVRALGGVRGVTNCIGVAPSDEARAGR